MSTNSNIVVLSTEDTTAAALVATIKSAVNGAGKYAAYVAAHNVTRDNVKDHAIALAVLSYPNDKPVQTLKNDEGTKVRTRFGNAVQAAGAGLRNALDPAEGDSVKALLTGAGKAAELDAVIAAWHEAQA